MSTSIDSKIVTMKFDNAQFKTEAAATLGILDRLKANMNFTGIAKTATTALTGIPGAFSFLQRFNPFATATAGAADLQKAANSTSLSGLQGSIDGVSNAFIAMSTVAITALSNIVNRGVDAGLSLTKSLTVEPVSTGFSEYETNLKSIQTILANTEQAGVKLPDVNKALAELNEYSDKTIYNFSEMAKNIGTFTRAGVDLDTSVAAIKGISNAAALGGADAENTARAMYQISQALSAGKVGLQDWNSIENAGIASATFKKMLAETAVAMDVLPASAIELEGAMENVRVKGQSFRDSIMAVPGQESWLTDDVLLATLNQFTGDMTKAQIVAQGFTEAQAESIMGTARTALAAATEVKTLSGVFDVAQETAASGWARTFQLIFGDFKEAKTLFTNVSTAFSGMIASSAEARNEMFEEWNKLGGRDVLIESLKNAFEGLMSVLKPVKEAFRTIFPATTGKGLYDLTVAFRNFTENLTISDKTADGLKRTLAGVFAVFSIGIEVVQGIIGYIFGFFQLLAGGSGSALQLTGSIGDLLVMLQQWLVEGGRIEAFFQMINDARAAVLGPIIKVIGTLVEALAGMVGPGVEKFIDFLKTLAPFGEDIKAMASDFRELAASKAGEFFSAVAVQAERLAPVLNVLGAYIRDVFEYLLNAAKTMDFDFVGTIGDQFQELLGYISNLGSGVDLSSLSSIGDKIKQIFGYVRKFVSNIDFGSIFDMGGETSAAAAGLSQVSSAAKKVTNVGDLVSAAWEKVKDIFSALGGFFAPIGETFKDVFGNIGDAIRNGTQNLDLNEILALVNTGFFIAFYSAARSFMSKLGNLTDSFSMIGESAAGVLDQVSGNLKTMQADVRADIILKIAGALVLLVGALFILSKIPAGDIKKGLATVAALLALLGGAVVGLEAIVAFGPATALSVTILSASLVALATALLIMAGAVYLFSRMDLKTLGKGLLGVAGSLAIFLAGAAVLSKTGGAFQMIAASVAIGILAVALTAFAGAIKLFSLIDPGTLGSGLLKIALALFVIVKAFNAMPTAGMIGAAAAIGIMAGSLVLIAGALKVMASLSISDTAQSLILLAGALLIVCTALKAAANPGTFAGSAAILVFAAALAVLVPSLILLGNLDFGTLFKGLLSLALIVGIFVGAALLLQPVIPLLTGLGGTLALIGLGIFGIGAGMLAFATGLAILTATGAAGVVALTAIIISIAELFPLIMQQFGLGIVAFAKVIGEAAPELIAAFGQLLSSLLKEITRLTPEFGVTFRVLLGEFLKTVRKMTPTLVQTGVAVFRAILKGIRDNIEQFTRIGYQIVINMIRGISSKIESLVIAATAMIIRFLKAIEAAIPKMAKAGADVIIAFMNAMEKQIPRVVRKGFEMVISTLNGIADAIRDNRDRVIAAAANVGDALVGGMVDGVVDAAWRLANAAVNAVGDALSAVQNQFSIFSPSRVWRDLIGVHLGMGMAVGLDKSAPEVAKSAVRAGDGALAVLRAAMSKVPGELSNTIDMNPVITPVLDISDLTREANRMSSLLGAPVLKADLSLRQARDISAAAAAARDAQAESPVAPVTQEIKFEQNNTSPKALSPNEVYRNTKNMLSLAKEELKV